MRVYGEGRVPANKTGGGVNMPQENVISSEGEKKKKKVAEKKMSKHGFRPTLSREKRT